MPLNETSCLFEEQPRPLWTSRNTPEQGMWPGESDIISVQPSPLRPALWRQGPSESHFKFKTLGTYSFVKNTSLCSPERSRRDSRAQGATYRRKVSPFSIPVTKMNMEKIITFKTYLILERIPFTCRRRMLSDRIFPISLIKLLSSNSLESRETVIENRGRGWKHFIFVWLKGRHSPSDNGLLETKSFPICNGSSPGRGRKHFIWPKPTIPLWGNFS